MREQFPMRECQTVIQVSRTPSVTDPIGPEIAMKLTIRTSFLTLLTVSIVGASWSVRHFGLAKSIPDAGSSVQSPEQLQLWFTQAPQDGSVTIRLIDAAGDLVQTGEPVRHADDAKLMEVEVGRVLDEGTYTVAWRGIGDDGHVVRNDVDLSVAVRR